jgi:hypothetical protein
VHVTISVDLNINLNAEGITSGATGSSVSTVENKSGIKQENKESAIWEIPDFGASPKIDFGKKD